MDFTVSIYNDLVKALIEAKYTMQTYAQFVEHPVNRSIILRHDVDKRKKNSLNFASIQHQLGVKGTYYFRVVPESYDEKVIREISEMGHEIGYHYETMDTCKGDVDGAYNEFCRNLERFRKLVNVTTICMHGSPLSKFDNREIWKKYNYKQLGLIAEPYFDLDFNRVFYLTDTGRKWDGDKVSVRDKVMEGRVIDNEAFLKSRFHTTQDIISAIKGSKFPDQVMMTFHPQRWTDNKAEWCEELIVQNVKNIAKAVLVKQNNKISIAK